MKLLYSDILPLGTEENQETIMDCFNEQMKIADRGVSQSLCKPPN
ncbi:hypothetical protein [Blautia sp.]|nr:hypothetical protein [Blautia sp.]